MATNFRAIVAKIFGDFLGHFEILHFQVWAAVDTFWAALVNIRYIFNITSGHTLVADVLFMETPLLKKLLDGGCYFLVDSFAPTILQCWVQIPTTPSILFPFIVKCFTIFVMVSRKG